MPEGFTVEIPVPPSINVAFKNVYGKGRKPTKEYMAWKKAAGWTVLSAVPAASKVSGAFKISINLPEKMPGDIDNRVKGIIDILVAVGRIDDDRHCEELHVRRRHDGQGALVHVKPFFPSNARLP